jgi:hypothetical protein
MTGVWSDDYRPLDVSFVLSRLQIAIISGSFTYTHYIDARPENQEDISGAGRCPWENESASAGFLRGNPPPAAGFNACTRFYRLRIADPSSLSADLDEENVKR